MYSRFSKKEIVALGITGMSTLLMVSVLFMASASTSTTEDFITGLETAFPAPATSTGSSTTTGTSTGTSTNTSTNTWNTTTGTNSNTNTSTSGNTTGNSTTTTSGNNTSTSGNNTSTSTNWGNTSTSTNTSSNNNTSTNSNTSSSTNSQGTNTVQSAPTGVMQTIPANTTTNTTTTTPVTTTTIPVFSNSTPTNSNGTAGGVTSGSTSPGSSANTAGNTTSLGGGLNSASQCNLPAIKILQVEELDTKTIVRWREIIGAAGYDVLKKSQSGEFVFIERVTKPIYTAHLARGAVKYEDFKIAAVCWDTKSASMNTSEVTSVKTGPVQFLLLIVLSMNIGAALMLRKNYKKS